MSFGSSMRFDATVTHGGKPVIFWEQQAQESQNRVHSKKKFNYKKREQKFPLRSQQRVAPAENEAQQPIQGRGPGKSSRSTALGKPVNDKTGSRNKATGSTAKTAGKPKGAVERNTVTLSEQQLKSILETIGQLTSGDSEQTGKGFEEELLKDLAGREVSDSKRNRTQREDTPPPVSVSPDLDSPRHVEPDPSSIPGLTGNSVQTVHVQPDPGTIPGLVPHPPEQPKASPRLPATQSPSQVPKQPLSKMELKRLQWEKERAEAQKVTVYNPWGRPGAGAPVKDNQGNVLADYNRRKEDESEQDPEHEQEPARTHAPPQAWKQPTPAEYYLQTQGEESSPANRGHHPLHSTQPLPSQTQPQTSGALQPAALRSSFTIGEVSPDENRFMSAKERQKKEWLDELEKQREEARQRKLAEKDKWLKEGTHDTWADKLGGYQPTGLPNQAPRPPPIATKDDHATLPVDGNQKLLGHGAARVNSAPVPGQTQIPEAPNNESDAPASHLRAFNTLLDPQQIKDLEEKRRRHLEHQEAIRAQVEEKERLKRMERERKMREEQEEEARLQHERDLIQKQFQLEQMKARQKEEQQQERVAKLKEAMDQAQEQAEREKHERRMRHLAQAGHDTTALQANYEESKLASSHTNLAASSISLPNLAGNHDNREAKMTPRAGGATSVMHVEPTYVPGLHPTPRDDVSPPQAIQSHRAYPHPPPHPQPAATSAVTHVSAVSQAVQHEPYTENRVLTPTQYRAASTHGGPTSPKREFGTQTEFKFSGPNERSETEVDIEYKGPLRPAKNKNRPENIKKVRLKSAAETQSKDEPKKQKGTVKISERPRWGQSGGSKKQVKQSERDPNYEKRRKRMEAARTLRQQDLLAQVEKNARHIPGTKTVASRARSRSPPMSVRNRSDSPPRVGQHTRHRSQSPPQVPPLNHTELFTNQRAQSQGEPYPQERSSRRDKNHTAPSGHDPLETKPPSHSPHPAQTGRSHSPPIPTLRHKLANDFGGDPFNSARNAAGGYSHRSKYGDEDPTNQNLDFVPFVRSQNILDPAHADDPLPVSREPTTVQKARQTYIQNHQPGSYGQYMDNFQDEVPLKWRNDPIMNPGVVTDHPTVRQDRILQQLSSLRLGLLQKQQEYASGLTPSETED